MTREDAKAFMRKAWRETAKGSYTEEAYEMAIKALEQPTIEPQQTCEYWDGESKFCALCRPSVQPEVCEGCKHLGKWENEVEYGYPSPCTRCKRRVGDHYER